MPQVTRGSNPNYVSPAGYEVVDTATATEIILKGQAVAIGAAGMSVAAAGATDFAGVALADYYASQEGCDYLVCGEMDGFVTTGITVGSLLYPSASVAGQLQSEAVAGATPRARVVRSGRIRVNCV